MFLVPSHLRTHLNRLLSRKTFHQILHRLLTQYSEFIVFSHWNRHSSLGKQYQEKGQLLLRIGAKVRLEDLIELKTVANGLGISYCLLFAKLLELDELGWGRVLEEGGVVRTLPKPPTLLLKTQFFFRKYQTQLVYRI
ncbi:DUF1564 family protein [Leptospira ilyithenensis]|nr:DUF1564 family protein [Leptospira ilyithenensis]